MPVRRASLATLALLLAASLAGCAEDPPPMVPMDPVPTTYDGPLPGTAPAPLRWHLLADHAATLVPPEGLRASVPIPPGTIQVLVNLTAEMGAARGLRIALGECTWARDVILLGAGDVYGADCGGLPQGTSPLAVATDVGALTGRVQVTALVCQHVEGACPQPLPVTRE